MEEFTPNKIAFQSTKVERVPANKTHRHVFVPVTLTLTIDPMTLIYELNLIIVKSYVYIKMESLRLKAFKS